MNAYDKQRKDQDNADKLLAEVNEAAELVYENLRISASLYDRDSKIFDDPEYKQTAILQIATGLMLQRFEGGTKSMESEMNRRREILSQYTTIG